MEEIIMMSIKKIRVSDRRAKVLSFSDIDSESIPKDNESHILMVICEATKKERKYIVTINKKGSVKARCNSIFSRFMSAITLGWYQSSSAAQLEESLQTHQKEESERQIRETITEQEKAEKAKATQKTKKQIREENEAAEAAKDQAEYAKRQQLNRERAKREAENKASYKSTPVKVTSKSIKELTRETLQKHVDIHADGVVPTLKPSPGSINDQYNKFIAKENTDKE